MSVSSVMCLASDGSVSGGGKEIKTSPFRKLFPIRSPYLTRDQRAVRDFFERHMDEEISHAQIVAIIHGTVGYDPLMDPPIARSIVSFLRRLHGEPVRTKVPLRGGKYKMDPFFPEGGRFLITLPNGRGYMLKSWEALHGTDTLERK